MADPLVWTAEIDWNNDGVFEADEANRLKSLSIDRGRVSTFTTDATNEATLTRNMVGTCSLDLDNYDRRYDPWYTGSLISPNVLPGRDVRLKVKVGTGGTPYAVFRGMIDEPTNSGYLKDQKATISVADGWRLLTDRKATTALRAGGTPDQTILDILTAIGWPTGWSFALDTGSDVIPYAWVENQDGFSAIHDLVEGELGLCWIGADGKMNFVSRHTLYNTLAAFTLDQSQVGSNPIVGQPWDFVKNKIRVQAYARTLQASAVIWTCRETPLITPGQTITIIASFQDSQGSQCPAQNVLSPVAAMDYRANSNADSSGLDRTSSITVLMTALAASATITITNGGANAAYLTFLQVRGRAISQMNASAMIAEDAASQTKYGLRALTIDSPFQQIALVAQDFATWLVSWTKDAAPLITVEIVNNPTVQFAYDLGTYLTFTSAYLGINRTMRICRIRHESMESMQAIKTTWTLEPVPPFVQYWLLGVPGYSELGVTTILGY